MMLVSRRSRSEKLSERPDQRSRPQIDVAAMVIRESDGTATIPTPTRWCSLDRTLTAAAPVRTVEADDTTVINPSVVMALE